MKAVAFDLGGVLVDVDRRRAAALLDLPRDAIDHGFFGDDSHDALTIGTLSPTAYLERSAARLGAPVARVREAWAAIVQAWPGAERLIARVRVRPLVWSNTDPIHFERLAAELPVLAAFERGADGLSFRLGAAKPDPAFFARALDRAGLAAHDVLFLDDREENVAAARTLGIDARLVEGGLEGAASLLASAGLLEASAT